jgi:hypothetical protein
MDSGVQAFVALGGTRLDKGAGDPNGAIVRVGFYRQEGAELFLPGIVDGGWVEVELAGVRFNQGVRASPSSLVQHLKYSASALEACGAPSTMGDVYSTGNPSDDLAGRIRDPRGVRPGFFVGDLTERMWGGWRAEVGPAGLDGARGGHASLNVTGGDTARLRVAFPYAALRHVVAQGEPPLPGRFSEPDHFHVEFEAVPSARRSDDESS